MRHAVPADDGVEVCREGKKKKSKHYPSVFSTKTSFKWSLNEWLVLAWLSDTDHGCPCCMLAVLQAADRLYCVVLRAEMLLCAG